MEYTYKEDLRSILIRSLIGYTIGTIIEIILMILFKSHFAQSTIIASLTFGGIITAVLIGRTSASGYFNWITSSMKNLLFGICGSFEFNIWFLAPFILKGILCLWLCVFIAIVSAFVVPVTIVYYIVMTILEKNKSITRTEMTAKMDKYIPIAGTVVLFVFMYILENFIIA